MSVYKPSLSRIWKYDFVLAGKRYTGSTGVLNRRAAEAVERKKRNEAALGELGVVSQMTLDAASGRWWDEVGKRRGDAVDVERRIEQLLNIIGKTTKLCEIDQARVATAIEVRRGMTFKKGKAKDARAYPVSDSTVNRDIIEILRPILRRARSHWTTKNDKHGLPDID